MGHGAQRDRSGDGHRRPAGASTAAGSRNCMNGLPGTSAFQRQRYLSDRRKATPPARLAGYTTSDDSASMPTRWPSSRIGAASGASRTSNEAPTTNCWASSGSDRSGWQRSVQRSSDTGASLDRDHGLALMFQPSATMCGNARQRRRAPRRGEPRKLPRWPAAAAPRQPARADTQGARQPRPRRRTAQGPRRRRARRHWTSQGSSLAASSARRPRS